MLHGAGIFTNICPKNHQNVGKYTIHGACGNVYAIKQLAMHQHLCNLKNPELRTGTKIEFARCTLCPCFPF